MLSRVFANSWALSNISSFLSARDFLRIATTSKTCRDLLLSDDNLLQVVRYYTQINSSGVLRSYRVKSNVIRSVLLDPENAGEMMPISPVAIVKESVAFAKFCESDLTEMRSFSDRVSIRVLDEMIRVRSLATGRFDDALPIGRPLKFWDLGIDSFTIFAQIGRTFGENERKGRTRRSGSASPPTAAPIASSRVVVAEEESSERSPSGEASSEMRSVEVAEESSPEALGSDVASSSSLFPEIRTAVASSSSSASMGRRGESDSMRFLRELKGTSLAIRTPGAATIAQAGPDVELASRRSSVVGRRSRSRSRSRSRDRIVVEAFKWSIGLGVGSGITTFIHPGFRFGAFRIDTPTRDFGSHDCTGPLEIGQLHLVRIHVRRLIQESSLDTTTRDSLQAEVYIQNPEGRASSFYQQIAPEDFSDFDDPETLFPAALSSWGRIVEPDGGIQVYLRQKGFRRVEGDFLCASIFVFPGRHTQFPVALALLKDSSDAQERLKLLNRLTRRRVSTYPATPVI